MFHFVTQTMSHLKQMLDTINVTYEEKIFESEDGIAGLGPDPFVSDLRTLSNHAFICLMCSFGHTVSSKGSQHSNTHHCDLRCACKTTAL